MIDILIEVILIIALIKFIFYVINEQEYNRQSKITTGSGLRFALVSIIILLLMIFGVIDPISKIIFDLFN